MALISGLYEIVDQQCTAAQISGLLRVHKDTNSKTKSEIRVSGTKPELIINLQRVVSLGLIPKDDVFRLIQESEENGHQRIYYFRPKRSILTRCNDGAAIARELVGTDWDSGKLPRFDRHTKTLHWSDFRVGLADKRRDWLGKLYGHEQVLTLTTRQRQDVSSTHYREILDYEAEDYNTVLVVRWNGPELLEIRIDQTGLQKAGAEEERLSSVWEKLAASIPENEFEPWDLREAMTNMLRWRVRNRKIYSLGTVRLLDGADGTVQFDPYDPTEVIDGDVGRTAAVNDLLTNSAKGTRAAVTWMKCNECSELLHPVVTVVTGEHFNCLAVSSKTSAGVLDYVTNRLREYS